ncbi:ESPR-type extended signal peptide-containing protein, partial [Megamonas funiformis]|uniref:ESPR-type extended signal peptide-containing protein n=2 Tax=Megamonas funiformis TaxID=437897 RepID=UPI0022E8EB09
MNKIYKVIWSKVKHQYVVVSELAHSNGKQSRTSRNSIRSRIAALVVCGAIAAFGVFSALPNSAFAAGAGAITTSGQYIAVAVDPDSGNDKYWDGRKNRWVYYKVNDTRTFTDAQDKTHTYTFVNVGGKNYWVREGYTITIEEGSRFTAYDQSGDVIAPEDGSFIIDSQKSPDADDAGLISSSEVVLAENEHRQTNSGALVDVSAGIYGGAVNSGGTEVKSRYNYYINDNNSGWKDVGNKENISGMGNYFRQVFRQSDGTYRTATGITVSTDNLYVIDGKLGAFFNSNNSVYTGNVYGLHNEVLMTGVDSVNGNYYSYWGTKINDPNMSMSNMTIGEHDKIVDGLQTNIDHVNGDIVQEIKLDGNKAGQGGTYQDGKGGTINLERRGYWNGTEFVDTGSVDGGITISSEGGTGGKDVAIKFANEDGSFTVDAGSKVEGKTENGGNALTGLSINGEEYTIAAGGKSVTRGSINNDGSVKIYQGNDDTTGIELDGKIHDYALDTGALGNQTVTADNNGQVTLTVKDQYGNGTDKTLTINGLVTEDNLGEQIKAKNNLTVTEGTTSGADGGNWQIEDSKQPGKIFKNTTLVSKEITPPTSGYENTYDISDTDGNTVTLKDVASATKLSSVDSKVGDTQYTSTNYIANGQNLTTAASNLDSAIKGNENKIGALDGRVVNVENDTITGGSIDTDGKINLRQKDGTSITTDNAIHDWKVTDANLDENGTLTLNTENAYGGDTGEVTVNNVASTGYVTNQINANNTIITEQYEDYFNENDKYLNSATFDNNSGELKLTVAKAGENGAAQEYSFDLGKYVEGKDVYVNQISIDKDNNKLILNRKNATPLELGLEELSDIGVSSTDYQLVENPANGSDGKYTVDNNGNLTLTVKDLNNKNAATKTITISGLAKKTDVAVIHDQYKDGEYTNLRDTKAQIWDETSGASDKKSSSIALGKDAFVSVQNGRKADAILFGSDTYTGGIAIGQDSKALNGTVNIGVKDYTGKMGDVIVGDPNNRDLDNGEYNTYTAMGVGETSVGSNSYISGSLSTNIGSYNVITTKYMNGGNPLDSAQNFGSITVGTLNSIESNSSDSSMLDTIFGKVSGVANSVVGMANKTQNSNGSLVFGTGNEITNSIDTIPTPSSVSGDVADVAENFRDSVSDRNKSNGGAVLAIGGGNKADYAQNSQLIGVQNEITGTSRDISKFNMINGYQNTITNGSNDTVIGTKNTVTNGDSNVVLGDNHTVQNADNNVILGSSDKVATQTASNTVVIGYNAQANSNNDVAIGSGSVANGAVKTAGYAGANPIGTVSVGSEGNERTITNVAAGRINEDSTDAVNGSQLYATNQNVTNLTTKVDAGWSLYSNGKEVKNVKPGNNLVNIDSGENVSITKNEDGNGITISADLKDLDVEDTNAVLYDNEGKTSVTLGGTGHEAVKLTNVAAGALTETSTDAVNGSQLFETNTKVDAGWSLYSNGKEVKNVKPGNNWISIDSGDNVSITKNEDGNGIKISADLKDLDVEDTNAVLYDDEGKTTVTLGGEGHEAVKLTNVAAGTVNATSTDAINGSQLYEVQQQAGKHTTVTVNGGMTAPEDGSYTHDEEGRLDGNLLL